MILIRKIKQYWFEISLVCVAIAVTWLLPVYSAMMFVIWYWIAEGATEGYTWSSGFRRLNNLIIKPGIHDSQLYKEAKGRWCYHSWRAMGENVGMFGANILFMILAHNGYQLLDLYLYYAGANLIGIFFYERIFNHISYNDLWPQKASWDCCNGFIIIPRAPWQDFIFIIVGLMLIFIR